MKLRIFNWSITERNSNLKSVIQTSYTWNFGDCFELLWEIQTSVVCDYRDYFELLKLHIRVILETVKQFRSIPSNSNFRYLWFWRPLRVISGNSNLWVKHYRECRGFVSIQIFNFKQFQTLFQAMSAWECRFRRKNEEKSEIASVEVLCRWEYFSDLILLNMSYLINSDK